MKRTAFMDYHGVPLCVEFEYYPGCGATLETPPEPATADIRTVKAGSVDIAPMLDDDQLDELSDACIEWVREDAEFQACEHADMLREERALNQQESA